MAMSDTGGSAWAKTMVVYYIFAKEFGWRPTDVDALPLHVVYALLYLIRRYYEEWQMEMDQMKI